MIAILVVLVLNLVVLLALARYARGIRRRNAEMAELVAVTTADVGKPVQVEALFKDSKDRLITIEILNPAELAATQSRFSGVAGGVAPGLIRKIVYDRTVQILREQLVAQGVQADVRLHVGA
jgi:hypothetical protein